ncbi:hypothetical protein N0V83_002355 [Neocucurbitaria cava]|uniref:Uncharacterized protein n=1 Tax=Neocucurbitaria cava TaxID=798079 RepID=A0A9W8YEB4_9PLEO|nr:hypothetical protein N0V83_002355 [Neocucurbitaria cava]
MTGTRSSARNAAKGSSPAKSDDGVAGTKRKPEAEPSPKRSRKATKKQATIEETLGSKQEDDSEMKDATDNEQEQDVQEMDQSDEKPDDEQTQSQGGDAKEQEGTGNAKEENTSSDAKNSAANGDDPIEKSSQRAKDVPSNILEKGIIYFFTRNRVGIEDADSVADLQRTFFVLRPIPTGAKLGDGALTDQKNNRLLALPKKAFPKSHNDRFMAFVEKANTTVQDLKENFFAANEYETKTQGTRRTEPITPVAEGVYAITRTEDATTHLVYSTTIPAELGEVQEDLGIKSQGSFIISVKNPERSGPAAAQLPQKPDFPKEIIEEFRNLAWTEVKPKYLDYEYCQILLIGEKIDKAVEPTKKDQKHDKETPQEEIDKLEHEDELRIQHLHGDDSVFDDLKISKDEYPKYNLESIKRKAAEAIIDRLPFMHDALSTVDLAICFHEQFPQIDLGLRKATIKLLQARLPAIMEDELAWKEFSDNKVLLKAFHAYQCEMADSESSTSVPTPPATPPKK